MAQADIRLKTWGLNVVGGRRWAGLPCTSAVRLRALWHGVHSPGAGRRCSAAQEGAHLGVSPRFCRATPRVVQGRGRGKMSLTGPEKPPQARFLQREITDVESRAKAIVWQHLFNQWR